METGTCTFTLKELHGFYVDLLERVAVLEKAQEKDTAAIRQEAVLHLDARDKALRLEANELSRRLDALNGEAGRIKEVLSKSITRELADEKFEQVKGKIAELQEAESDTGGRRRAMAPVVVFATGLGTGLILWVINYLVAHKGG